MTGNLVVNGNIGIGSSNPTSKLEIESETTDSASYSINQATNSNFSVNGSFTTVGHHNWNRPTVKSSVTQSGTVYADASRIVRNTSLSSDDNGILSRMIGLSINIGHDNDTAATPVTNSVTGIQISPLFGSGSIGNYKALEISSPVLTGGTITEQFGIYQNSTLQKNYFTGDIGLGTLQPFARLHVSDNGATSTGAILIDRDSSLSASPRLGLVDTSLGPVNSSPVWYIDNNADSFRVFRQPDISTGGSSYLTITNTGSMILGSGGSSNTMKVEVRGEVRTVNNSGASRVWGQGRPGTSRYGTTGVEAGLCSNGGIRFGLSKTAVYWGGAEAACPSGTWVCTRAERGTGACDTARPDTTCDHKNAAGVCGDQPASQHWGHIADVQNNSAAFMEGEHINESGSEGGGSAGPYAMPVWCCSN